MLVLSRKVGEQICVPQFDIVLTVLEVRGQRVRLGITAPQKVHVVRKELRARLPQNRGHTVGSGTDASVSTEVAPAMKTSTPCRQPTV